MLLFASLHAPGTDSQQLKWAMVDTGPWLHSEHFLILWLFHFNSYDQVSLPWQNIVLNCDHLTYPGLLMIHYTIKMSFYPAHALCRYRNYISYSVPFISKSKSFNKRSCRWLKSVYSGTRHNWKLNPQSVHPNTNPHNICDFLFSKKILSEHTRV